MAYIGALGLRSFEPTTRSSGNGGTGQGMTISSLSLTRNDNFVIVVNTRNDIFVIVVNKE